MKILTFSTLFPNPAEPIHGVFVENRLRHLAASGEARIRVVAPVPWVPFGGRCMGRYGRHAAVPQQEERHGLQILHPRYPTLPKVGMTVAPVLLALSQRPVLERIIAEGYDFDLIDAHYFYPDGVAAVILGHWLRKPVVITGRGTDLNFIPQYALPRRQIQWAARHAAGMITVCQALKDSLVDLGAVPERVSVLPNGVDLALFRPLDGPEGRMAARAKFRMNGVSILSVGLLIERKGHHLIIAALKDLPGVTLYIAGEGPDRSRLESLARNSGVTDRVRFLGALPQAALPELYCAADALVLASSREGWANVLLEAMACGTPVVASRIWGTPEVVATPQAGVLMPEYNAGGVAAGVKSLLADLPERSRTRAYAERFSWDATTAGQLRLFREILNSPPLIPKIST